MRTTERTMDLGLAKPTSSLIGRLTLAFAKVASVWRVLRNRREVNGLNELTDSQLKDIGLTRHDLESALTTSTFFEDPSAHLTNSRRRSRLSSFGSMRY
ncbi:DUF1127 domain-containing protein [Rhizobium sp. 2YAF20]|jgi:uncharacterized protein YjiS (DUF1127 family)|uniref:DUF1127 domain-containing protein n=1 Tax=Rhizobium sp. 2YAF20 TaxID=3233027 RepID=UPI003F9971FB